MSICATCNTPLSEKENLNYINKGHIFSGNKVIFLINDNYVDAPCCSNCLATWCNECAGTNCHYRCEECGAACDEECYCIKSEDVDICEDCGEEEDECECLCSVCGEEHDDCDCNKENESL